MSILQASFRKKALIIIPLIIGIAVFILMVKTKTSPPKIEMVETAYNVRVVKATHMDVIPNISVHATVSPEKTWNSVSEVSGRIIHINPRLKNGNIIKSGRELLRIDPVDYQLALSQLSAEFLEINIREKNTHASLAIEKRNLSLSESNFIRKQKLHKKGSISRTSLDQAEQALLINKASVQNLENTIALIPAERDVLAAKINQASRDLEQTIIYAPFDIRVANLQVENNEYVALGKSLFNGDSIDKVEILAQVPVSMMPSLLLGKIIKKGHNINGDGTGIINDDDNQISDQQLNLIPIAKTTGLTANISMEMGNKIVIWQGEVVRIADTVDVKTQTIGIIVAVNNPYKNIILGVRPPLVKGMFVKVNINGAAVKGALVIPRLSIRQGVVNIINDKNRLERRKVNVIFSQGNISIIKDGIDAEERVIISDLIPAVDGMLLNAKNDDNMVNKMQQSAIGSSSE